MQRQTQQVYISLYTVLCNKVYRLDTLVLCDGGCFLHYIAVTLLEG